MRRPEEEEEVISKLPEVPTEPPTLGRSEFNVPSLHDRSYVKPWRQKATCMIDSVPGDRRLHACMYVLLSSLWASFGDVLGCVMLAKNCPIIESDSDDSDASNLDQVPCNVKLIQGWGKCNSLPTASRIPKHGSCRNGTSLQRLISCSYIGFRGRRGSSSEGEAQEAGSSSMNCWSI